MFLCFPSSQGVVVSGNAPLASKRGLQDQPQQQPDDWRTFQRGDRLVVEQQQGTAPVVFRVRAATAARKKATR